MRGKLLVLHGYTRPGDGYAHGECFGRGYLPYELSAQANIDFAARLANLIARNIVYLGKLRSGGMESFTEVKCEYQGWMKPRTETTTVYFRDNREHLKNYNRLLNHEIFQTEQNIRFLENDVKTNAARIANWKLLPLPGEK
jgi:hypothetical protein